MAMAYDQEQHPRLRDTDDLAPNYGAADACVRAVLLPWAVAAEVFLLHHHVRE